MSNIDTVASRHNTGSGSAVNAGRNLFAGHKHAAASNPVQAAPDATEWARKYLEKRGLSPEIAQRAGIEITRNARTVDARLESRPALVIYYFDPLTDQTVAYNSSGHERHFFRVRYLGDPPANGFVATDSQKARRYSQPPGSPVVAYFAPGTPVDWTAVLNDASVPLCITEGEIKGLCACENGIPTIALGGVYNFRVSKSDALLPELDAIAWKGRTVLIAFDSDVVTKADVQVAERLLCCELVKRGAAVHLVRLPAKANGEKQGLDDLICSAGADAAREILLATPATDPFKALIVEGTDVEIADSVLLQLADAYASQIIFCEGDFYAYRSTHWRSLTDHELANAVISYDKTRFRPGASGIVKMNEGRCKSILAVMRHRAADDSFFADAPEGINTAGGFVVFNSAGDPELLPHDRAHRQRHCLPGSWSPGASWRDAPLLSRLLEGCFGADKDYSEKVALVGEACGVAALGIGTELADPKALVCFGPTAANGKSELIAMISGLLPPDAVCAVPPTRFSDERMLAKLIGCTLNACAELGTAYAIAADTFKSVITGDRITAREIYKPAVFFSPCALHLFATNVLPPFHGGFDRGVQRRLLMLTFNRSIPAEEQIVDIGRRVAGEEADALVAFAVDGAARIIKTRRFTEPASSRAAINEWIFTADPVLAWMGSQTEFDPDARTSTKAAYALFQYWAQEEGYRTDRLPSAATFGARLRANDGRLTSVRHRNGERFIVGLKCASRYQHHG